MKPHHPAKPSSDGRIAECGSLRKSRVSKSAEVVLDALLAKVASLHFE
jgi:hypothetical protein